MEETRLRAIAEVIVDLYEMRVSTMHKYQNKYEKVQDNFQYSFFNTIIAQIYGKYNIPKELVDEVIRERADIERLKENLGV